MTNKDIDLQNLREEIQRVQKTSGHYLKSNMRKNISRVTVIVSGSRCGSSFLFQALRKSGLFWTPNGEETPLYRLCNVGRVQSVDDSDHLSAEIIGDETLDTLAEFILNDLGRATAMPSAGMSSDFISRLLMQWPQLQGQSESLKDSLKNAASGKSPEETWWSWLNSLNLSRAFYDGQGGGGDFPFSLEELPWIVPTHTEKPTAANLDHFPLLLKTSTHVYRKEWLQKLFPNVEFRWIFLKRNPLAAINGLMDGWLSEAFHSHDVGHIIPLRISGYSNIKKGGERWWKFDLPPGWSEYTEQPLERVAAFQWNAAYKSLLTHLDSEKEKILSLKYENLRDLGSFQTHIQKILQFSGVSSDIAVEPVPPVMSTQPPSPGRWKQRRELLIPLLQNKELNETARELGYDVAQVDTWT